jgi:hypothetical protein
MRDSAKLNQLNGIDPEKQRGHTLPRKSAVGEKAIKYPEKAVDQPALNS